MFAHRFSVPGWLAALVLTWVSCVCFSSVAPARDGEPPTGYGRHTAIDCDGRPTSSCVCIVRSLSDEPGDPGTLRSCLNTPPPRIIRFSVGGVIRLQAPIELPSFTVVDGQPLEAGQVPITIAATGRLFVLRNTENVEISGLRLQIDLDAIGGACPRPQRPADVRPCGIVILALGSRNTWIHNNAFSNCGGACIALWTDKLSDGRIVGADQTTISRNVFRDSYYGVFAGAGNFVETNELPSQMRTSINENLFTNIFRRSPKASSGVQMHLFNNVISDWGRSGRRCSGQFRGDAASAVGGAQLLVEANVFSARQEPHACRNAVQAAEKIPLEGIHREYGKVRLRNNVMLNGAFASDNEPERVFDPSAGGTPFYYPYRLLPADGLDHYVRTVAGPHARSL